MGEQLKSVDLEQVYPKKTTEDALEDYGVELNRLKNKALPEDYENSEYNSGVARRRIEEYLEKKRLKELLQEDVVDDVFH